MDREWIKYYRIWVVHSIFYSFSTTISITYYQPYAIKVLGFDTNSLGNITLFNLLMVSLGNVLGSYIVNKFRARRVTVWKIFTSMNLLFWALTGFSDTVNENFIYLFISFAQLAGAVGNLAYVDTIGDMIPVQEAVKTFGKVNFYTLASSVLALSISLAIFNFYDIHHAYRIAYAIALITAIVSATFLFLMKDLSRKENKNLSISILFREFKELLNSDAIKGYIVFMTIFTFFVNLPNAIWNFYIIKVFNGNENWISLNTISSTLANALGNYILGRVSHKISRKKVITFSTIPISLVPAFFLVSSTMDKQIALNIFSGFSWSAFNLVTGVYNIYLGRERRIFMVSLLGILTNISAGIASKVGASVASISLMMMNLVFILSFIGRLVMYFYAKKNIVEL
ncbi:MAG: MFS transporter [Ignisphaera sp.]